MALTEKATAALSPTGALHSKGGLLAENVTVKYDSSPGLYIILMLPLLFACPFFSPTNKWRKIQPFVIINSKQISTPESGKRWTGGQDAVNAMIWFGANPQSWRYPSLKHQELSLMSGATRSTSHVCDAWSGLQSNYQRRKRDIQR